MKAPMPKILKDLISKPENSKTLLKAISTDANVSPCPKKLNGICCAIVK